VPLLATLKDLQILSHHNQLAGEYFVILISVLEYPAAAVYHAGKGIALKEEL
jgi:hypothetical protein